MSELIQCFMQRATTVAELTSEQVMSALIAQLRNSGRRARTIDQKMQFYLKSRKISSVEMRDDLSCDGSIEPVGKSFSDGFKIILKKRSKAARLRFTVAHELCHTFFYELVPEIKYAPHEIDPMEERLCDFGAAELLMPAESVLRIARSKVVCLESLQQLAMAYQVSMTAMFLRLRSLHLWKCELSEWHRMINGTFALEHFYGGKPMAWEWDDKSILGDAWQSTRSAFGHCFVKYKDKLGRPFYKPTRYEARRVGEKVLALWGTDIDRPTRSYPLLDVSGANSS